MLSVMEVILALKSTPLFCEVPGEGLKRLSDFIQEKSVSAGEVIFAEQDLGDEMYLVHRGSVSVQKRLLVHQGEIQARSAIERALRGMLRAHSLALRA